MTGLFRIAPRAKADLNEIWMYIAKDNVTAGNRLFDRFHEKFAMLSRQPLLGELHEDLDLVGLRSFHVGSYVIYYLPADGSVKVEIVRVMHGARDIPSHF